MSTILSEARPATRLCFTAQQNRRSVSWQCLTSSLGGHCQNTYGFWQ